MRQLGVDRVVDFVFGVGEGEQHLLVELYANGNILLTDSSYKILTLLRTYKLENDVFVATNRIYPTDLSKAISLPSLPQIHLLLTTPPPQQVEERESKDAKNEESVPKENEKGKEGSTKKSKKGKGSDNPQDAPPSKAKSSSPSLKQILSSATCLFPSSFSSLVPFFVLHQAFYSII